MCTKLQNSCLIENVHKKKNALWILVFASLPPIYMLNLLYLFSSELVFKVWDCNLYIEAAFLWQLTFSVLAEGTIRPYLSFIMWNLKNEESLSVYQKTQCCLYEVQTVPLDKNDVLQAELQLFYTEYRVSWNNSCFCNPVCTSVLPF